MTHTLKYYLRHFFYLGGQPAASWVEQLRLVLGAFLALMLVITIDKCPDELVDLNECLIASLGAYCS